MPLCGSSSDATWNARSEDDVQRLAECDDCWEQMEFLRWA
jgi:hypothetical protein